MGIILQHEPLRVVRMLGETGHSCQVEGRLNLPTGMPALDRVLSCRARVRDPRATAVNGRILIEGLVEMEVSYLTPVTEPEQPVRYEHLAVWSKESGGALPFVQEIAVAGVTAEDSAAASAVVTGSVVEPLDGASLRCQVSLDLTAAFCIAAEVEVATEAAVTPPGRLEVAREILHLESPAGTAQVEVPVNTILILPETKPDLVRLVSRTARLMDLSVEIVRGRAIVEGRLEVNAVYINRTEDGGQALEVGEWGGGSRVPIGFEAFVDLPGLGLEGAIEANGQLGRLQLEPIGPREFRLDATAIVTAKAVRMRQVPVVMELIPGAEELVDMQRVQLDYLNMVGAGEQEFEVETTLELPSNKPDLERILQVRADLHGLTAQPVEGRCLIDGWVDISLLYLAESPIGTEPALATADWLRGQGTGAVVTAVVELPACTPGSIAVCTGRLGRISVEQVSARVVRLFAAIPARVKVYEPRSLSAIVDAAVVPLAPIPGRPSMLFYLVQPGDSLWGIARRYQTTVEALLRLNKIADPAMVPVGGKLLIPRSPVAV